MPHVCGDEPFENKTVLEEEVVCPTYVGMNRMKLGSFWNCPTVCPTYVGMNRKYHRLGHPHVCMPHVCGDEPAVISCLFEYGGRMPHVCGDEPQQKANNISVQVYAPRMWG